MNNHPKLAAFVTVLTALISCTGVIFAAILTRPDPTPTSAPPATSVPIPTPKPVITSNDVPLVPNAQPVGFSNNLVDQTLRQGVSNLLGNAIWAEIFAYQSADASLASTVFAGNALASIEQSIATLTSQGLYMTADFDFDNSAILDVRVVSGTQLEVDTCEYWRQSYYDLYTDTLLEDQPFQVVPQTITMVYLDTAVGPSWFVTDVTFYEPPSFC